MSAELDRLSEAAARLLGGSVPPRLVRSQLIQDAVLVALDETGLLDVLTLQGGSAVAGCYGGTRLSNDLDFCTGRTPSADQAEELGARIGDVIEDLYETRVRVKLPKDAQCDRPYSEGVTTARWEVRADAFEGRPDIPLDVVKLEVASVPHETENVLDFSLPALAKIGVAGVAVVVETPLELVADKIVSLCSETRYLRIRDVWDIAYLERSHHVDRSQLEGMVERKAELYGVDMGSLRERATGLSRDELVAGIVDSVALMLADPADAKRASGGRATLAVVNRTMGVVCGALGIREAIQL